MRMIIAAGALALVLAGCGDKVGSVPWLAENTWRSASPAERVEICDELATSAGWQAFYRRQVHAFEGSETPTRSAREFTDWIKREKC